MTDRARDREVEMILVGFQTTEVQVKLLFIYSESVVEYGGVGIPESQ